MPVDTTLLFAAAALAARADAHLAYVMDDSRRKGLTPNQLARRAVARDRAEQAEAHYQIILADLGLDRLPAEGEGSK
jgi:phage terminase large subunit-like protein